MGNAFLTTHIKEDLGAITFCQLLWIMRRLFVCVVSCLLLCAVRSDSQKSYGNPLADPAVVFTSLDGAVRISVLANKV